MTTPELESVSTGDIALLRRLANLLSLRPATGLPEWGDADQCKHDAARLEALAAKLDALPEVADSR